ncbi:MAG: OmpA family protein [Myxococcota bacterium]
MKSIYKSLIFTSILVLTSSFSYQQKSFAQGGPISIQKFRPAMDSKGHFAVDSSQVLGHLKISLGFGLTSAFNPLVLEGNNREFVIDQMLSSHLQIAIGLFKNFEIGAGIPLHILSGYTTPRDQNFSTDECAGCTGIDYGRWNQGSTLKISTGPLGYDRSGKFGNDGVGDAFVNFKWRILPSALNPVGLAFMLSSSLPSGTDEMFMGTGGFSIAPNFIVDKRMADGKMLLSLNLGGRFYLGGDGELTENEGWSTCETYYDRNGGNSGDIQCTGWKTKHDNNGTQNLSQQYELTYGAGLSYKFSKSIEFVTELFGSVEMSSFGKEDTQTTTPYETYNISYAQNTMPVEALAGLKLYLATNSFLAVGGGVGITGLVGDHVGAPDFRLFANFTFEPFIGDSDGDGIPDDVDECPYRPEDFDGFQDEDGCPDPDNDEDGILDVYDKCPNEPETVNGYKDEDGCPDELVSDRDGDGIPDHKDQCPDDPEDFDDFEDEDGCPDTDNDGDGIPDIKDLCPGKDTDKKTSFRETKEDFDKFQDDDGCPDPDNDGDGILDVDDKCPNEPETFNGYKDKDGCPDKGKVRVTAGAIEIYEKIYFATAKSNILPKSYSVLDAIAATLKAHKQIKKIEIQGHTDDRGSNSYNMKLSDDRANSVRSYLIDKGISPTRLTAKGYGESRPIDKRRTKEARAKNRRVEFVILERGKK